MNFFNTFSLCGRNRFENKILYSLCLLQEFIIGNALVYEPLAPQQIGIFLCKASLIKQCLYHFRITVVLEFKLLTYLQRKKFTLFFRCVLIKTEFIVILERAAAVFACIKDMLPCLFFAPACGFAHLFDGMSMVFLIALSYYFHISFCLFKLSLTARPYFSFYIILI